MDKTQFFQLLQKYRLGTATEEEREMIKFYYDLFETEPEMLSAEEADQMKERLRQTTWSKIREEELKKKGRLKQLFSRPVRVAAAIIALLATGLLVYFIGNQKRGHGQGNISLLNHAKQSDHADIRPGGNKAVLTLANGQKLVLDNNPGTQIRQGTVDVQRPDTGELIYTVSGVSHNIDEQDLSYNTITTPLGGKFKVALSDGTRVWLNAGSSLRYPVAFAGRQRQVWLSGEAYFEVAKQSGKSFLVEAGAAEVQVLGTRFNVNAYGDETLVRTTLTEGAVKMSAAGQSRILKPGEEASINKSNGKMKVAFADVEMALAWTRDLFLFDNTNIKSIMRDVSRWYDVEVIYETKNLGNKNFSGVMSRYEDVDSLLQRLELTGVIHFKIVGKKITVMD